MRASRAQGCREARRRPGEGQRSLPLSPGAGGRSEAGQVASAGHWNPGAREEAPPLPGRPPLSMEPATHSPSLPSAAAVAKEKARLYARTTRRQLRVLARTGQQRHPLRPYLDGPRTPRPRARHLARATARARRDHCGGGGEAGAGPQQTGGSGFSGRADWCSS